ncbi:GNAT family N-acetyltransferase [Sinobacterium caligoides]|uniref:GNAT family N-acetyltransferase n=1 Tax=Sinobacterium caligoides TaxID=933926 RepID=UPI000F4CFD87|nr:GNAT family N-acetyltransferase [Sinobacterium caligoides]
MVDNDCHGQSIGTFLLKYRLANIGRNFQQVDVLIDTSQHTVDFYKKHNFTVIKIEKDGYGHGLDKVHMLYKLGNAELDEFVR